MNLVIMDGPRSGTTIDVSTRVTLGREDADVRIDDDQISRVHAEAVNAGDGLEIRDLGSLNGTWVNDKRIEGTTRLRDGDIFRIGATRIAVGSAGQAQRPFAPSRAQTTRTGRARIASRKASATIISVAVIAMTSVALVIYFAGR
ncbi:MAG: FHA domain-containing protein [Actinomycetota bacterium]